MVAALALAAGCGSSEKTAAPATPAAVREALESRLHARQLSFEWVYCLRTPRVFGGNRVFRCNVNFGEPHIVRYCATLEGEELVTNREQPEMRCHRLVAP